MPTGVVHTEWDVFEWRVSIKVVVGDGEVISENTGDCREYREDRECRGRREDRKGRSGRGWAENSEDPEMTEGQGREFESEACHD